MLNYHMYERDTNTPTHMYIHTYLDEAQSFSGKVAHPQPLHVQHCDRLTVLEVRLQHAPHVLGHEDVVPLQGLGADPRRSDRREIDAARQLDPHGAAVARPAVDEVGVVALDDLEVRLWLPQHLSVWHEDGTSRKGFKAIEQ